MLFRSRSRLLVAAFVSLLAVAAAVGLFITLRAMRRRRDRTAEVLDAAALEVLARSAAARAAKAAGEPRRTGRVCPRCGARYPAEAEFCGQDGARLEAIN